MKKIVSIGLPVYNMESTIRETLESLLNQTFSNFEMIISDNDSTDSTSQICQEYAQKDERIRYYHQNKNMGPWWNFMFVLEKANGNYFLWAAGDDTFLPTFIEKNLKILESNDTIVGSTSNVEFFGREIVTGDPNANFNLYKNFIQNIPKQSSYEQKASYFLRYCLGMNMYSLFKTQVLRECVEYQPHVGGDLTILLKVLKFGDLHVINEVLLHRSAKGITSGTNIESSLRQKVILPWIIFPYVPLTLKLAKIMGMKIFWKNIGYFLKLNYHGERSFFLEFLRLTKRKFLSREKS